MTRRKMHGGYTSTPEGGFQQVVYWTCGHFITISAETRPSIDCPQCAAMTDEALEKMIAEKHLIIETLESA